MKQESEPKLVGAVFLVFAAIFLIGAVMFVAMDRTVMDNIAGAVCGCGAVLSLGVWAHLWMADKRLRLERLVEIRLSALQELWRTGRQ